MNEDDLLINEYKICHDGYISRDGLVPTVFTQMLRTFILLVAFVAASKILSSSHMSVGIFLYLLVFVMGFTCLFAYAVNIEAKASTKKALRIRMVDIELAFVDKELPLNYWKSVVTRKKSWIENIYKIKQDERNESGSASNFFVFSAWLLVFVWVLLAAVMFFGDIQFPKIGMS